MICKYFLPFCRLSFCFVDGFLCCAKAFFFFKIFLKLEDNCFTMLCAKAFKFNWVPTVYFCFCFLCLRRQIQKNMIYVKEYSAFVFF